ncbi:MAG TPA: flagellar protein FlgN [Clostridiaceae bacterium]|nr:flagellar protein FlgN [Clostridiaceae bacterium]
MISGIENIRMLNNLLKEKYNLLEKMWELTKKQSESIAAEDIVELMRLIDEKQTCINAIDQIDEEFDEIYIQSKGLLNVFQTKESNIPEARELKQNTERIVSVINDIMKLEKENNEKVKDSMLIYKKQINNIAVGRKAISVYNKPYAVTNPSYFIDKKK